MRGIERWRYLQSCLNKNKTLDTVKMTEMKAYIINLALLEKD